MYFLFDQFRIWKKIVVLSKNVETLQVLILKKLYRLIDESKHHILKAAHPSGLSAHRGFFGCRSVYYCELVMNINIINCSTVTICMTLVQFVVIIPIVEILFYNTRRKLHFSYGALLLNLCYGMIMNVDGKGKDLGKGEEHLNFFFLNTYRGMSLVLIV